MVRGHSHSSFHSDFLRNTISKVITRERSKSGGLRRIQKTCLGDGGLPTKSGRASELYLFFLKSLNIFKQN